MAGQAVKIPMAGRAMGEGATKDQGQVQRIIATAQAPATLTVTDTRLVKRSPLRDITLVV